MATKTEKAQIDLIINGETANKTLRDLEAAGRKAKSELRGLAPDSARFKELTASLQKINGELDKTKVAAGLAKSSWDKMKESIKTSFIGNLGANLATLGLQKVAGYFTDSFSAAVKLSDQLADVRKTTGMTADEAKRLRSELSQINTRTSMSDLMEIAKVGGQFGIAKEQINGFVQAVDKTAVALGDEFSGGAEQVATEMSKLRNIFKDIQTDDVGTDVGFISNAINELAAAGVATGPVVADLANRIGGYGIQVGLTSGQTLGLSATLQELGVTSERGGTAVVKILQKMLTNTSEFAKIAGMELGGFKDLLNKDIYGAFVKVMEGSKQLGPNAGLLAGIIKDLEVQGAGASEVFAKLGSNTELLASKTDLATASLTNTASITEEFNLRNENLAGSVDKLSKEWNKLISNPAMVSFFELGIDLARQLVGGLKFVAETIKFNYDVLTKGFEEANRIVKENQTADLAQENANREKQIYAEQLAVYKQHLNKMSNEELVHEAVKIQMQQKAQADYMRDLMAEGNKEQFYIELRYAKQLQAEANAIKKLQQVKINETIKGNEELSKEDIKAATKKAHDAQAELDRIYKLQMQHYDDLIKAAEKNRDDELKILVEKNKAKFKEISDSNRVEIDSYLELMRLSAQTRDEEKAAIQQFYLDKMATMKEGTWEYKLAYEQLQKELADIDKKSAEDSLKTEKDKLDAKLDHAQQLANQTVSVVNMVQTYQSNQIKNEQNEFTNAQNVKKAALKKQLDAGIIDRTVYDAKIGALDAVAADKEKAFRQKEAEANKKSAIFTATVQAALLWIEAFGKPWKIPAAVAGTLQAGIIAATPV